MKPWCATGSPLVLLLLACSACATTPGENMAASVATMRAEHSAEKLVERGRAFASIGDYTRAEQYLAAAIDVGAEVRIVLPLLLKVCIVEKHYRSAIGYAEPMLKKHPDDHRLRLVLGSLYAAIGETKTAREHLEIVAQKEPKSAEAHYALAVLFQNEERDPVNADLHFREYLRLEPAGVHAEEAQSSLLRTMP